MKIKKLLITSAVLAISSFSLTNAAEVISEEDWQLYQEGINPGEVFAEDVGGNLFNKPMGPEGKSCASCHTKNGQVEERVAKAAAYYPKYDPTCGKVINLEQRIQLCQSKYQKVNPFSLNSQENVALTTYLFYLAAGTPINVDITSPEGKQYYEYGKEIFDTKRGKRNLSCQVCHEFAAGKILRMQPLYPLGTQEINGTPGRASASLWPAFRMTKNKVQTLQQRFVGCQKQAGQKPLPLGSKEMVALEVYVKSLSNGVPLKTPGLRR